MLPTELYKTRDENMEFCEDTFRGHIYQEEGNKRAAPVWRLKRKIETRKKVDKEQEETNHQWMAERLGKEIADAKRKSSTNYL